MLFAACSKAALIVASSKAAPDYQIEKMSIKKSCMARDEGRYPNISRSVVNIK